MKVVLIVIVTLTIIAVAQAWPRKYFDDDKNGVFETRMARGLHEDFLKAQDESLFSSPLMDGDAMDGQGKGQGNGKAKGKGNGTGKGKGNGKGNNGKGKGNGGPNGNKGKGKGKGKGAGDESPESASNEQ